MNEGLIIKTEERKIRELSKLLVLLSDDFVQTMEKNASPQEVIEITESLSLSPERLEDSLLLLESRLKNIKALRDLIIKVTKKPKE